MPVIANTPQTGADVAVRRDAASPEERASPVVAAEKPPAAVEEELLAMLPVLKDAHKKTPPGPRTEALEAATNLLETADFKTYEPFFLKHVFPVVLERLDDKPKVKEAALKCGEAFVSRVAVQAFGAVIPYLTAQMDTAAKWQRKAGSLKLMTQLMARVESDDRDLLSGNLPAIIPPVAGLLYDTKSDVADAADVAINAAMKGITNRDLEPFIPNLIAAMKDRAATNETIQSLGGVVFVQTVEGSALSVVVPLMIEGFRNGTTLIKRMCSRIVSNMSKLVEEPLDAAPFLVDLIPAVFEAIDTIADPEARSVATVTHEQLVKIDAQAKEAEVLKAGRKVETIAAELAKATGTSAGTPANIIVDYAAAVAASLVLTKTVEEHEYTVELSPYLAAIGAADALAGIMERALAVINVAEAEDLDEGTELCNCDFTLAYGTKILLHNTKLRLLKGVKYGLIGQNDCGKSTLMRAVAEGSLDNFPDKDEVSCVFVEADIQGELSHLNCVEYVLEWPAIKAGGFSAEDVRKVLLSVGFTEGKAAGAGGDCDDPIDSLSGGWRMKLALARAMLQKADILLMDEPTNHLDVANVKWVKSYIQSLADVTVVMCSSSAEMLNDCCTHLLQMKNLKIVNFKGNLNAFKVSNPEVESYFSFKSSKIAFTFPQPGFLEGVKSRGKALLKMDKVQFTYPGNTVPTINDITIRASMGSRVAVVGRNGAGKSTMIKVLTGEMEPTQGTVWKYPNSKIGYIAQHAFVHIEKHLTKTPNEYIRWRYEFGDDREGLDNAAMKLSEADEAAMREPVDFKWKTEKGEIKKERRSVERMTNQRRDDPTKKGRFQYEVAWVGKSIEANTWYTADELAKFNAVFEKMVRIIDHKIATKEGMMNRPLTQGNVEEHLANVGLEPEYGTHFRMGALSGGQKVKVVLAAAMWDQPHIIILDEPTNYLDRDSLGALAKAIEAYQGGVIMITHNDAFCRELCPERWVMTPQEGGGRLDTEGDVEWMNKLAEGAAEFEQVETQVDASGNEVKAKKKLNAKEKKKLKKAIQDKIKAGDDLDSDEENWAVEWNL